MCLLTYFPPGIAPDTGALVRGAVVNPHGHGFAVVAGSQIVVGHDLDPARVIANFELVRARYPGGPALFHSRFATKGAIHIGNCHPFYLGGDGRTVLAHNGTLPKRVHPRAYDPRSDTRIAAEDYLPTKPFGSLDSHRGARGLTSWLGSSKLVILTVDPAYRQRGYIFNEQAGFWRDEIWYSNASYRPLAEPAHWERLMCGGCFHFPRNRAGRYCPRCGWCFHCELALFECACLTARSSISDRSVRPLMLAKATSPETGAAPEHD
ncbi:class II glutamine amidotransferase [Nocardia sp. XZ_19_385]|uniref:class II glutamine amidotransferase n=1 Tax=Nocardia sp. XZ_19_385 TaxID=2769488 RepID=UPI00188EA5BE|nr:class II glutamine amidotransferase [Nocardia sp. XZ_19_385]